MVSSLKLFSVFIVIITLLGCKKKKEDQPKPIKEETIVPQKKITFRGYITQYDDLGIWQADYSITKLTLEGNPEISVLTDSSGSYTFSGIPEGFYILRLEKEGYPTQRIKDFKVDKDREGSHWQFKMVSKATHQLESIAVVPNPSIEMTRVEHNISLHSQRAGVNKTIICIWSLDSAITKNLLFYHTFISSNDSTLNISWNNFQTGNVLSFNKEFTNDNPIPLWRRRQKVFFKVYTVANFDPTSIVSLTKYTTISDSSEVISTYIQ